MAEYRGTKQELNQIIEQYFKGKIVKKSLRKRHKKQSEIIALDTPLLECDFSFNRKFRDYFAEVTGTHPFKFTADMASAWRKVKSENDIKFTIRDMIKIYYGESNYVKYDNSACQWNKFLKDFCLDKCSDFYANKLKVAAILWKEVRDSKNEKLYSRELLSKFASKIEEYRK